MDKLLDRSKFETTSNYINYLLETIDDTHSWSKGQKLYTILAETIDNTDITVDLDHLFDGMYYTQDNPNIQNVYIKKIREINFKDINPQRLAPLVRFGVYTGDEVVEKILSFENINAVELLAYSSVIVTLIHEGRVSGINKIYSTAKQHNIVYLVNILDKIILNQV